MKIPQVPECTCNVSAFTATVTRATHSGVSWAVAAAQPHAGSEQLPASPQLPKRAEVALNPCEGIQLTPVCPSSAVLHRERCHSSTRCSLTCSAKALLPVLPPKGPHTHLSCVQSSCWAGNGNQCRDEFSLWMWGENWLWEWVWFSKGFCQGCLSGSGHMCKEHHEYLEFSLTVSFKPPHQQLFYYLCNFFFSFFL